MSFDRQMDIMFNASIIYDLDDENSTDPSPEQFSITWAEIIIQFVIVVILLLLELFVFVYLTRQLIKYIKI